MSWIDNWIQKKVNRVIAEQKAAMFQQGVRYQVLNGRIVVPADNKQTYVKDGYSANDIIYSVFQLILDKVRLPEWGLYKIVDESSLKQYKTIMSHKDISPKDAKKALTLRKKALEEITKFDLQSGKLNNLLQWPNECDTFQNLITNACAFKMLTGDAYLWGDILTGGANQGIPNSIWELPSQFMNIKVTDTFPVVPSSYELTVWNQQFTKESILHDKYWNPNWDIIGQQLHGFSPLKSFLKNTTRNNSAKDASIAKFQNGGLEEIIYMDDPRYDAAQGLQQAQALKLKLSENEYAGPNAQGKKAISGVKVGVAQLGLSPVDLGIIDSEKWDAIMFCNGYGVPPELLGLVSKTFNNIKEAEKALTTRSAFPLLTSMSNGLNRKIQTDWGFKGKSIYIDYDKECFTELQTDIIEVVNGTSKMIMITPNEEREMVGFDARPEPEADEPWVLSGGGRVPLSDYQQNQIDQQLMNDVNGSGNQQDGTAGVPKK